MKQHITVDQLNELTDKGKERLREWWKPTLGDLYYLNEYHPEMVVNDFNDKGGKFIDNWIIDKSETLPLLSIGQMIEFLGDNHKEYNGITQEEDDVMYINCPYINGWKIETLCDELWEAVKKDLEME